MKALECPKNKRAADILRGLLSNTEWGITHQIKHRNKVQEQPSRVSKQLLSNSLHQDVSIGDVSTLN